MSCINPNSKEFQDILKYQPNFILAELEYNKLYPSEVLVDENINTEINELKEEPFIPNPKNDLFILPEVFSEEEVTWEHDITNDKNVYIFLFIISTQLMIDVICCRRFKSLRNSINSRHAHITSLLARTILFIHGTPF